MTSATVYAAIKGAMTTLGYTASKEFFDLDTVPESIAHKAFRIGGGDVEYDYNSCPGATFFRRSFSVWVLFRPLASDPATTYSGTILPFEDALIAALHGSAYITEGPLTAEYAESADYIALQLTIPTTYKI